MRRRRAAAALLTLVLTVGLCLSAMPLTTSDAATADCGLRGWDEATGWQYVIMGRYPYYEDGTEAPVLWQVLDVDAESGKALLLTTYIIDACQPIWVDDPNVANKRTYRRIHDYGESDMNTYCNETLFPRLMQHEPVKEAVTQEQYGYLYPLSSKELMTEKYGFPNIRYWAHPERTTFGTPYAKNLKLHERYGSKLGVDGSTGTSSYWATDLKVPNSDKNLYMQLCGLDGHLSYGYYNRTTVGLRVALRLDISRIQVASGAGTIWDPCTLAYVDGGAAFTASRYTDATPVPTTPRPRKGKAKDQARLHPVNATPVPTPAWLPDALGASPAKNAEPLATLPALTEDAEALEVDTLVPVEEIQSVEPVESAADPVTETQESSGDSAVVVIHHN